MLKSSGAMAVATMASRLLGMVREMVYASFMGTGWVASAFTLAFQVPNLFRRLLGEGALTAAFIPIFKQKQVREGEAEMWRSSNAVISGLVTAAAAVTALAILVISIALRLHEFRQETELMLQLLRFMFPYMLLVCLAAVLIGMANARGHFFVPALGSAILNIVMNAVEAMPAGGRLRFESAVMGENAEIRIADSGPGIPPALREKIFRLYFTTKEKGSGIGLAMTFRIVQLHDGTIDFASEPGKGATFVISLAKAAATS